MNLGRSLRPLYVALVGVALAASIAVAATCTNGASPTPSPASTPTLEAVVTATPTQRKPEDTPTPPPATATSTPYNPPTPTATPPQPTPTRPQPPTSTPPVTPTQQPPPPTATATPPPPKSTATATPTLEERVQSIVDKYRNDTTTVINDYATIKPVVDAVLQGSGLKYDNLTPQIWAPERFNKFYCQNDPKCIEGIKDTTIPLAFVSDKFVIIREAPFYQAITVALREMMLGIAYNNYNAKSEHSAEIAGNLGFSFANHTLAEKFGYDPHNNVADTDESRLWTNVRYSPGGRSWLRVPWLINEDKGHGNRSKPQVQITAEEALEDFKFFTNHQSPEKYADDLLAKSDIQRDGEWVTSVLRSRLKLGKEPTNLDAAVLRNGLFYLP